VRARALVYLAAAGATLALAARVGTQDRFADVKMRAQLAGPGVAMLAGAGGNIGVCWGADGVLLVDDQFAPLSDRIRASVDSIGGGKPLRWIFNTHWHGDHTGGNEKLAALGATIVAHDNVRRRMAVDQIRALAAHDTIPASPPGALPIVTFNDSLTFHVNGEEVRVFHVRNAHTDGDAIVQFVNANVVHMGDCFFNGIYPVIDLSTGGSIEGMIAADERALKIMGPDTQVIPGHGPLGDRAALQAFHDMLVQLRDRVRAQVRAHKTLEQTIAAKPTAALDAQWGKGGIKPDRIVEVVYTDLSRRR
jgi:cyclase